MAREDVSFQEKREFTRLKQVLPLDFRIVERDKGSKQDFFAGFTPLGKTTGNSLMPPSVCVQRTDRSAKTVRENSLTGFTYDVSKSGLRLKVNILPDVLWKSICPADTFIKGIIHIPFTARKIKFLGEVVWKKTSREEFGYYELGIRFKDILPEDRKFLIRFAKFSHFYPKVIIAAVCLLLAALGWSLYNNTRIVLRNRRLVRKMAVLLEDISLKESSISQSKNIIAFLENKITSTNKKLNISLKRIEKFKQEYKKTKLEAKPAAPDNRYSAGIADLKAKISELNNRIESLKRENEFFRKNLVLEKQSLKQKTSEVSKDYSARRELENKNAVSMYQWLKSHQDQRTGLIISYEGDDELQDWAFTYDQSLAVFVFLLFKDYQPARKILDFYLKNALMLKGGFINSYYASSGSACEYIVRSGPNTWIGLASLAYFEKTKDKKYLDIALRVYKFLKKMQDKEGGIIGGPAVKWYSTEHNLDGYAFFMRMYSVFKDKKYLQDARQVLAWIDKYAYTAKNVPINRGRGDSTIATDTYAWSIAAIGPQRLIKIGMDPAGIMDFALNKCKTKTVFKNNGRNITVEGFDFARAGHIARGGVVSCEWTAQMIVSFGIMARFYKTRDRVKFTYYKNLAKKYLSQLQKMIISSPSPIGKGRGCLPYASAGFVDTGHGWRTPKNTHTGSVSATAYYIFAYLGYNPLNPEVGSINFRSYYE